MQFTETQFKSKASGEALQRLVREEEEEDGGIERHREIRTCIYQACQKKANHHGSLTAASGQFNLIWSEANKRGPAKALQLWKLWLKASRGRNGETEVEEENVCAENIRWKPFSPQRFKGRLLWHWYISSKQRQETGREVTDDIVISQNVIRHPPEWPENAIKPVSVINGQIM